MLNIFIILVAVFPFPFLMPSTLVVISSSWTELTRGTVLFSCFSCLTSPPSPPPSHNVIFLVLVFPSSSCSGLIHLLLIIVFTNPSCWLCWFLSFFNRKGYLWKSWGCGVSRELLTAWIATLHIKSSINTNKYTLNTKSTAVTELCGCTK